MSTPASPASEARDRPADGATWPFGVYIHVPYCRRRCRYCDFYFEVGASGGRFAEPLLAELSARLDEVLCEKPHPGGNSTQGAPARASTPWSVYLGGGTPTALTDGELDILLSGVRERLPWDAHTEVTLEANPEDLLPGRCTRLAALGVQRISMGLQSLDDVLLRYLGRAHRGDEGLRAVERARDEGIGRVSVDLIAGVPGERMSRFEEEVSRLRAAGVAHISAYLLTVEAGTPLEHHILRGRTRAPDEDAQVDAYEHLQAVLRAHGYAQYEVSSFALPGEESRHNRLYWAKGAYLGLGPGAHSMRLLPDGSVLRRHTTARLDEWSASPVHASRVEEVLEPAAALLEAVAFGLRDLHAGVCLQSLAARHRTVVPPSLLRTLERHVSRGNLRTLEGGYALTPLGARFADAVARDVLAA